MKKDYPYSSPEYKLEDAKESIDAALESIKKTKGEIGQKMPVEEIKYVAPYNFESFYKTGAYRKFNETREDDIREVERYGKESLASHRLAAETVHERNKPAIENNEKVREKIISIMGIIG